MDTKVFSEHLISSDEESMVKLGMDIASGTGVWERLADEGIPKYKRAINAALLEGAKARILGKIKELDGVPALKKDL